MSNRFCHILEFGKCLINKLFSKYNGNTRVIKFRSWAVQLWYDTEMHENLVVDNLCGINCFGLHINPFVPTKAKPLF